MKGEDKASGNDLVLGLPSRPTHKGKEQFSEKKSYSSLSQEKPTTT